MGALDLHEIVHALDPRVYERARRVRCAIDLIRAGMSTAACNTELQKRYGISQPQAWRVVRIAIELEGPT